MAIVYGKKVGWFDYESTPPKPSDDSAYSWYRTLTATTEATITESGWYRIYVVGNGGNGGPGTGGSYIQSGESVVGTYVGAGGGGGGVGGYAIYEAYLRKGQKCQVTLDDAKTQIEVDKDIIYATHGGNGGRPVSSGCPSGDCCHYRGGVAGTAGTASGGNIGNYDGANGYAGSTSTGDWNCDTYATGGSGGNSGVVSQSASIVYKYRGSTQQTGSGSRAAGKAGPGSLADGNPILGNAGSGGGGGERSYNSSVTTPGVGGQGYTGGVVLEKAS